MGDTLSNNKRIAKNTMLLYVRMLLMMLVGLYTSRVVLDVLGASNYGIYNVVGGIVVMASFLNSGMAAASQRFFSYELGKSGVDRLRTVFSTSVSIHVTIAIILLVLAETVGLWFLNTYLNIPADRMFAANVVYQFATLSFLVSVVSVPYNAAIIAHEHMNTFAYISIFETAAKLGIVYLLLVMPYDKLVVYSVLVFAVALVVRLMYQAYCRRKFEECSYRFVFDRQLFKEMFAFAGWSIVGNVGFALKNQGSNVVLNIFCGTLLNASRGIAYSVDSLIVQFATNFQMALNPQITKLYAAGKVAESRALVYAGCRYSFLLLLAIAVPLSINIDYVLSLWLVEVPVYTNIFLLLCMLSALINTMAGPLTAAMQATGNIRNFQITICVVMMMEPVIAYVLLWLGYEPWSIMYATVAVITAGLFARALLLKRLVPEYQLRTFAFSIVGRNLLIGAVCAAVSFLLRRCFGEGLGAFILTSGLSFAFTLIVILRFGVTAAEREKLFTFILNKLANNKVNTDTIYVLHEYGAPSHYIALVSLAKQHGKTVVFRAFNLWPQLKGCIKRPYLIERHTRLLADLCFLASLPLRRRCKVVIGIAPYNSKVRLMVRLLRRHEVYYHTSYSCWDGSRYGHAPKDDRIIGEWRQFTSQFVKHIFAVSERTQSELIDNNFATADKISVVNHSFREMIEVQYDKPYSKSFIYCGRMTASKGVQQLLDYFAAHPEAELTLVGNGDLADTINAYTAKCPNIHYAGYIKGLKNIIPHYAAASFLLLNSHRTPSWEELFGITLIEGMSCGCVPIATDHPGPKEVITDHVSGFICKEGLIAKGIDEALQMTEEQYLTYRKNTIEVGRSYHCDKMAHRWQKIFD